jgi:hypothetical protein
MRSTLPLALLAPAAALWSCSPEQLSAFRLPSSVFRLLSSSILLALPALALAQGSLTPPAAPAPTQRTLAQVETRTPVQAGAPGIYATAGGGFQIINSGSYYLTGNLEITSGFGIAINAGDVTLDLNGFTISSTEAKPTSYGIVLSLGKANITIRNGHIRSGTTYDAGGGTFVSGPGFSSGIYGLSLSCCTVEDVTVVGVPAYGILLNAGSQTNAVRRCSATTCGNTGILAAQAIDCFAEQCATGIDAQIAVRCSGYGTTGTGIKTIVAAGCYADSGKSYGVEAKVVRDTFAMGSTLAAISAGCATNCRTYNSAGPGITVTGVASFCHTAGRSGTKLGPTITGRYAFGCTSDGTITTSGKLYCH